MELLQNQVFRVEISPEEGVFSFITNDPALPNLVHCRLGVTYRPGRENGDKFYPVVECEIDTKRARKTPRTRRGGIHPF